MKALLAVLQIIPYLIEVLKAIETTYPEARKGAEKLALVKEMLEAVYPAINELWPLIEKVIGKLVAFFNTVGVFKKD